MRKRTFSTHDELVKELGWMDLSHFMLNRWNIELDYLNAIDLLCECNGLEKLSSL